MPSQHFKDVLSTQGTQETGINETQDKVKSRGRPRLGFMDRELLRDAPRKEGARKLSEELKPYQSLEK